MKNFMKSNKHKELLLINYKLRKVFDDDGTPYWKVGLFYEDESPNYQFIEYMSYKKRESLDSIYDRCAKLRKEVYGGYRFGEYSPWYDEPWEA